jgi:hypothetical protein
MAYVKFEINWFGPDGRRYRKNEAGDRLTYVPDELLRYLPSTARVVKPGGEFETPQAEGISLRDFDETRAITDAEGEMAEKAEAHRIAEQLKGAEALKLRRQEQAAKMRAAKAAKKSGSAD